MAIGGATNNTYVPVAADVSQSVTCTVTATNAAGSVPADSNAVTPIDLAPTNTVAPAISGSPQVGNTINCSTGTWTHSPTAYAYQWKRAGADITGATSSAYVVVSADVSQALKCTVTASNTGGSASQDSNSVTGATGASPTGLLLGTNTYAGDYWMLNTPLVDIFHGGGWNDDLGNLAATDIGSDGYPHQQRVGAAYVDQPIQIPRYPTSQQFTVTWDGTGMTNGGLTLRNCTLVGSVDYTARTATFTINVTQPTSVGGPSIRYTIADSANWPRNFKVRPVGVTGTVDSQWKADLQAEVHPSSFWRPMDWTGVNPNSSFVGKARPTPAYGLWSTDLAIKAATVPIEIINTISNVCNRNPHINVHPNADNAYWDSQADCLLNGNASFGTDPSVADGYGAPLSSSLTARIAVSNEPWNSGFGVFGQFRSEAVAEGLKRYDGGGASFTGFVDDGTGAGSPSGVAGNVLTVTAVTGTPLSTGLGIGGGGTIYPTTITGQTSGTTKGVGTYTLSRSQLIPSGTLVVDPGGAVERHVEKTIQVLTRFKNAWNAKAAPKCTFEYCFEMQNAAGGTNAGRILDYKPDGITALKDAFPGGTLLSAPYIDLDPGINLQQVPFTQLTVNQTFDMMQRNIRPVLQNAANIKAAAAARGWKYGTYEGGPEVPFKDNTFGSSIYTHARMYDTIMMYYQQYELLVGSDPLLFYLNSGFLWGLKLYTGQTTSKVATPKYQAHVDFLNGVRMLFDATATLANANINAPNGTSLGFLTGSCKGSTWALANNDGGRLAVNATTGEITVANGALLTIDETRTFTATEVNAGDPSGSHDTVLPYVVGSMNDNFNDNSTDSTKWLLSNWGDSTSTSTGVVLAEANQRLEITPPAATAARRSEAYVAQSGENVTNSSRYCRYEASGTLQSGEEGIFGLFLDINNGYSVRVNSTGLQLRKRLTGSGSTLVTGPAYDPTNHAWLRLRFDGNSGQTVYVDAAPDASGVPGTWTQIMSKVDTSIATTSLKAVLSGGVTGSVAAPITHRFLAYNTGA